MKKKSIIRRLIPWIIVLAAIAALIKWVFVPIYSQKENTYSEDPVIHNYDGDGKKMVLENDRLRFELDAATTAFKLTEKASGREWLSNPADAAKDFRAYLGNLLQAAQ